MRLNRFTPATAVGLALLLAAAPVTANSPAVGQWAPLLTSGPALFGPSALTNANGTRVGPDGKVYIFGAFSNAGGDPTADNLAVWDPATGDVHGLGSDELGNGAIKGPVFAVTWVNGILFVGGSFTNTAGVVGMNHLVAWNGSSWSGRGATGPVYTLDTAAGLLYAGGTFVNAGGVAEADKVAVWDGYAWSALGSNGAGGGAILGTVWTVKALADGRVYIGGTFTDAGGNVDADNAAWFDPGSDNWQKIGTAAGSPFNSGVFMLALAGNRVIAGGSFYNAGGVATADSVAEWTGSAWIGYGSNGAGDGALNAGVNYVALYGSNVIVGGEFTNAAGLAAADQIAVWNGAKWLALPDPQQVAGYVYWLDVAGRTLYVSGAFSNWAGIAEADAVVAYGLPAGPSAPRSVLGASGLRKVTLAWVAPLTANGASIRDYVVKYRKVGSATWLTFADAVSTARTATVTGLTRGATYQFQVFAKNDWGTGPGSAILSKKAG